MKLTRRQAVHGVLSSFVAGAVLSGCSLFRRKNKDRGTATQEWKTGVRSWWKKRQSERHEQRQRERRAGERPDVDTPVPYLVCGRERSSRGWLGDQIRHLELNEETDVAFVVENAGNASSWSCYAAIYEGPWAAYHVPFADMDRTDQKIVSLLPGETKEVVLHWKVTRANGGHIIARCFDPALDPGSPTYEQYDRKGSGVGWGVWGG